MKIKNVFVSLFISTVTLHCAPKESTEIYLPHSAPQMLTAKSTEAPEIRVTPQVDILFVIDNSWSMKEEIAMLSKNIPLFVEAIAKEKIIDFHIGVTTIWDNIRYQHPKANPDGPVAQFSIIENEDGTTAQIKNFGEPGELLPLKVKDENGLWSENLAGPRFVTQLEGFEEALEQTLLIQPVEHISGKKNPDYDPVADPTGKTKYLPGTGQGPEHEDMFTPVLEAFENNVLQAGANKGFLRSNSHKVIIFLTDADDGSSFSVPQLIGRLRQATNSAVNANGFSVNAVMYPAGRAPTASCKYDPILKQKNSRAEKLEDLVTFSQGEKLDICKNFGQRLADMGDAVKEQALKNIIVPLERYPEYLPDSDADIINWLTVSYGEQKIPVWNEELQGEERDQQVGWQWDFDNNSVIIRGANNLEPVPGAEFKINFTAVDLFNVEYQ